MEMADILCKNGNVPSFLFFFSLIYINNGEIITRFAYIFNRFLFTVYAPNANIAVSTTPEGVFI